MPQKAFSIRCYMLELGYVMLCGIPCGTVVTFAAMLDLASVISKWVRLVPVKKLYFFSGKQFADTEQWHRYQYLPNVRFDYYVHETEFGYTKHKHFFLGKYLWQKGMQRTISVHILLM